MRLTYRTPDFWHILHLKMIIKVIVLTPMIVEVVPRSLVCSNRNNIGAGTLGNAQKVIVLLTTIERVLGILDTYRRIFPILPVM